MDYKDDMVSKYLRGEQIFSSVLNGFGVLKINNISLGGYKANSGNLNNYYPKGLRNF
jgi:NOL1/NOP2/fmu family ribosome biogenesis protein